ncbi:helix-turn-helix domain-containing protein [Holophaga foetida]|uniref:helix-turn-helix domain-containing protein n=1 Tax=Holophaga foetida TaxID=35839 RepID=UPI000307DACD|nr:helix-turn-helix transcriptional regulator [Holophaga foetida]
MNPLPGQAPASAFPQNLRALRERLAMGQRDFADYLEVTQQTVSLWERGSRRPGRRTWLLLEQKLGYPRAVLESRLPLALPEEGVREGIDFAKTITLPPPKAGLPITRMGVSGLAAEAITLAVAQRELREAIRAGRPVWLVVG